MKTEPRSDIFSLGATLHHLLTGRRPIDSLTRAAEILNRRPDPYQPAHEMNPCVPFALSNFVSRMVALTVNDRPRNADVLVGELKAVSEQLQTTLGLNRSETVTSDLQPEEDISNQAGILSPALRRAQMLARILQGSQVLWVDDNPSSVRPFCGILNSIGVAVDLVTSSSEALKMTINTRYQLIISDIERDDIADEGIAFLRILQRRASYPRVIFFIANLDTAKGTPPGAFGITNSGEELLHLIIDALERECFRG